MGKSDTWSVLSIVAENKERWKRKNLIRNGIAINTRVFQNQNEKKKESKSILAKLVLSELKQNTEQISTYQKEWIWDFQPKSIHKFRQRE